MNWVAVTWSMIGGMSLALGIVQAIIWIQRRQSREHLVYAVFALSAAAGSIADLNMLFAKTPEEFARNLRLCHFAFGTSHICMLWFVRVRLHAGRDWLLYSATALRVLLLGVSAVSAMTINLADVQLQHVLLPGNVVASVPVGHFNPWVLVAHLSLLLMLCYFVDVILQLRRHGGREEYRSALRVCGSMIAYVLLAGGQTVLVTYHLVSMPYLITPLFALPILVLGFELGADVLRARAASERLGASESRLREFEENWELAGQIAGMAPWGWRAAGDRLELSPKASEMFGLHGGDLHLADWLARIHPEDQERIRAGIEDSQARDHDFERNYRLVLPGGDVRWISSRGRIDRDANGKVTAMHGVSFDLTEVRRVDAMFRAALEAAPNAFFLLGGDGRIELVNARACMMFGYTFVELEQMPMSALLPDWRPAAGPETLQRRELLARRGDGVPLPVELELRPFEGGRLLASVTDISERLRTERESAQQRTELAHLSRVAVLGEMSASLAHELNQPLTAIVSNAQAASRFLEMGPEHGQDLKEALVDIAASGNRAGDVIRRLRAMLKKEDMQRTPLDVNQLIHEVLQLYRSDLINRGVVVHPELDHGLPAVLGDRVQLQQVLLNLVINACESMANLVGERRLCICSRRLAGDEVEFAVCDGGPGIDPDRLELVFEPFVTSKSSGMGLGLSVCKTIVKSHGGRIWANNNGNGPGASFHVALAAMAQQQAPHAAAAELDRT